MTKILFPQSLERLTNAKSFDISSKTVEEALDALISRFATLQPVIFAEDKKINRFVNIYVDNENIKKLNGLQTKTSPSSVVSIVVAIAGG